MTSVLIFYGLLMLPLLFWKGTILNNVCFLFGLFGLFYVEYISGRIRFSDDNHSGYRWFFTTQARQLNKLTYWMVSSLIRAILVWYFESFFRQTPVLKFFMASLLQIFTELWVFENPVEDRRMIPFWHTRTMIQLVRPKNLVSILVVGALLCIKLSMASAIIYTMV